MFTTYIDTAIRMRASALSKVMDEVDTRTVLDDLSSTMFMVLIFKIVFRIRAPDNITRASKLQNKKGYIVAIDRYIANKDSTNRDYTSYRNGLVRL